MVTKCTQRERASVSVVFCASLRRLPSTRGAGVWAKTTQCTHAGNQPLSIELDTVKLTSEVLVPTLLDGAGVVCCRWVAHDPVRGSTPRLIYAGTRVSSLARLPLTLDDWHCVLYRYRYHCALANNQDLRRGTSDIRRPQAGACACHGH